MINEEKAMQDAINSIGKLNFRQLVSLQASLAEHIFNCLQHFHLQRERTKEKIVPDEKIPMQ